MYICVHVGLDDHVGKQLEGWMTDGQMDRQKMDRLSTKE